ncbi:MAG: hypothetical protein JWQ20_3701 [Conexibacter sp.]|jgi:hypothetical protein|nr:hypothetical protein [Conexibacter sp.]
MSRRDLAHVSTALWNLSGGAAGAGVAIGDVDQAIGRARDDMRTPLNLHALYTEGLVEQLGDGTWALTDEGVQRHRDDEGYAGR